MKVALVTGSSSGIGKATIEAFRCQGWQTIGLSRREGVDITDESAVSAAIERALHDFGRIDALVNNAGIGTFGATEFASSADVRRTFEVNFVAAARLVQLVLPVMRRQGGGRIINVASAAAMFPLPFQSVYSASKSAMLAWSRALAGEVARFGIRVSVVCPGDLKTGFTSARTLSPIGDGSYEAVVAQALAKATAAEEHGGEPSAVAKLIVACASRRHPPLVVIPGWGYRLLDLGARFLPRSWVSALIARFYV